MITIYIIATLGLFICWIKNIPAIAKKPWLERLFLLVSTIVLSLCSASIVDFTNEFSDEVAFTYLGCYFVYLFFVSIIFYKMVGFLSRQ
ncbi:hypothetical protein SAMN02745664_10840 [Moraxella cuniculi DSM 21768]|uniref:Uncharacterized protein n=1 Tax=Moraxella cuniculi DSM 21768 TaxID=1122245 RepID=A0A1N7EXS7_9GAMM|nr:hypothetical protein [Moraxella cuniculi]OOS02318.1 hypothetical protein B0189_10695 [Moraxella cuniculi]SIR92857.1 hypothetical protein SAMN02745664_10840 [Moraxella cuniculi DSM 21768]